MRQAREHEIQAAIVDAIELCGLTVYQTTAFRQKGASGVDKGIADLLVSLGEIMPRCYLALEVKTDADKPKWSSAEQKAAYEKGHFRVVDSPLSAVTAICLWIRAHCHHEKRRVVLDRVSRVMDSLQGGAIV